MSEKLLLLVISTYAAMLALPGATSGEIPITDGLIGYWPGDGNADDLSGYGNHGYLNAEGYGAGMEGEAFSLDGVDDYIRMPDSDLWAFGKEDFTLNIWANLRIFRDHGPGTPFFIQNEANQIQWFFSYAGPSSPPGGGGHLFFRIHGGHLPGGFVTIAWSPFEFVLGRWYNLALTRAGDLWTIYVNGEPIGSEVNDALVSDPYNRPLVSGYGHDRSYHDALFDELAIYNRALSEEEIWLLLGKLRPDFDRDSDVDGDDFLIWQQGFGSRTSSHRKTGSHRSGDADKDGDVDGDDFLLWQQAYGTGVGGGAVQATAVPEPSSLALLVWLTVALAGFPLCPQRASEKL